MRPSVRPSGHQKVLTGCSPLESVFFCRIPSSSTTTSTSTAGARWLCICTSEATASPVALSQHGLEQQAPLSPSFNLDLHHVLSGRPSIATLASILRHCGASKALCDGRLVHQYINRHGFHRNIFIRNCLVLMYAQCESMEDAQEIFDKTPCPNAYSWSILIKGYAQNDKLDEARRVFDIIRYPDVVAWNTMIAAYAQKQEAKQALDLFWKMQQDGIEPDVVTFICTLEACSSLTTLEEAQDFLTLLCGSKHAEDKAVKTTLLTFLGKFGKLDQAWSIFGELPHRDVVSWNAMIAAYAQNGHGKQALSLYLQMQRYGMANSPVTFMCALDACTSLLALEEGLQIHTCSVLYGCDGDLSVGNALIHMYGKCGCLNEARDCFSRLPSHNVVSWTALMTACVNGNQDEEALDVFHQMQHHGFSPNEVTFVCALDSCASLAALEEGFHIHAAIVCDAHEQDCLVGTALVHMYGKCGLVNNARCGFQKIGKKDVASWNAMLTACAQSGHGKETLEHFNEMREVGFTPNNVSFTCVLTVCSHMGWVDDGRVYFMLLYKDYGMLPTAEHCSCMIDLLGRAGCLEEAEVLLGSIHVGQLAPVWTSLLASCKTHGDMQRGLRAVDNFRELDPMDPAPFVMLANICAAGDD